MTNSRETPLEKTVSREAYLADNDNPDSERRLTIYACQLKSL